MNSNAPTFVITGQLSAGKSTVARALLQRFERGFHIDVDGIREMVVSGLASPIEWTDETTQQFSLAIDASAALASVYATAGFAVAIDGAVDPEAMERALADAGLGERVVGVVLRPRLDVALRRNRARTNKAFDTAILENVMRRLDEDMDRDRVPDGWRTLDNSDESVDETVERILSIGR